jgi:hypothetical protein
VEQIDLNWFAYVAMWGVVASGLAVLAARKPEDTCYFLIMAAILFLPSGGFGFKLPKVPMLDRDTLPYVVLFIAYFVRRFRWVSRSRPLRSVEFIIVLMMVGAVLTVFDNREPITVTGYSQTKTMPGLSLNDGLYLAGDDLFRMGLPFLVGRLLVRSPREATRLLTAFAIGGLVYSLFILWEVRMSPQLHATFYGSPPRREDFSQAIRWGGYRPIVFMVHGLAVALFVCNTVMAAFVLARNRVRLFGLSWTPFAFYLLIILLACKSLASMIYAAAVIPILTFTRARTQLRVAVLLASVVLLYPAMRASDLFPAKGLVSTFASVSPERAESLGFRLFNEDQLLEHSREKAYFGWGSYGRNIVYDKESGKELTVFDGFWIIMFSQQGAVGMACAFLLLLVPVFLALRRLKKIPEKRDQLLLAGLAIMVVISALDLLPNGLLLTYPYFLAGSLAGLTRVLTTAQAQAPPVDPRAVRAYPAAASAG